MNQGLTRAQLDELKCTDPKCAMGQDHPVVLKPRCHPQAGQRVAYNSRVGMLEVSCCECDSFIASVVVARPLN